MSFTMPPLQYEVRPLDWNETKWRNAHFLVRQFIVRVLVPVAQNIINIAKEIVSVQYPPASVGGEPPHRRTGMLQELIDFGQITHRDVSIKSKAPYSYALEYGTLQMEPRPFFWPSVMFGLGDMPNVFFQVLDTAWGGQHISA